MSSGWSLFPWRHLRHSSLQAFAMAGQHVAVLAYSLLLSCSSPDSQNRGLKVQTLGIWHRNLGRLRAYRVQGVASQNARDIVCRRAGRYELQYTPSRVVVSVLCRSSNTWESGLVDSSSGFKLGLAAGVVATIATGEIRMTTMMTITMVMI